MMKRPKFGSVYMITCEVNGKRYIGLTRSYVSNRWHQHKVGARQGKTGALYAAMRKHGEEAFRIDHIASALAPHYLGELERLLIAQHGTFGNGYNLSEGGERDFCKRISQEGIERIREARNKPEALAENRRRNVARMATPEGKAHQARMVDAARAASAKLSEARRKYAGTKKGAAQLAAAAAAGARRKAELSSKALIAGGRRFVSVREAAEAFGIERAAVRWRIKSARFDWSWA
jgi:group I intron endonuclease